MANTLAALYKFAIPTAIGLSFVQASIYDVKGGTRAVIFDRLSGVKETVVNEGTHFLIPWLQKSIIYDVRTKPRNISTTTGSKDLQMVSLTLRVLHRPEVTKLPKIYQVSHQVHSLGFLFYLEKFFIKYFNTLIQNFNQIMKKTSSPSVSTTTSVSSPPSVTKSLKPSSPNSTQPSSSLSANPSPPESAPTYLNVHLNSTSNSKTSPSHT